MNLQDMREQARRRAIVEFDQRFGISASGGEVLDLVDDTEEPGVVVVRIRKEASPAQRPAASATAPAQRSAAVEAANDASPVRRVGDESVLELIAKEDPRLRVGGEQEVRGIPGSGPVEPGQTLSDLAAAMVGDVLMNAEVMREMGESITAERIATDLRKNRRLFVHQAELLSGPQTLFDEEVKRRVPADAAAAYERTAA